MKTLIRFKISITGKQISYLLFWHRHLLTYKPTIEPILAILSDSSPPNVIRTINRKERLLNFFQVFGTEFFWRASVLFTENFKESNLIRESGFEYYFINRLFRFQQ